MIYEKVCEKAFRKESRKMERYHFLDKRVFKERAIGREMVKKKSIIGLGLQRKEWERGVLEKEKSGCIDKNLKNREVKRNVKGMNWEKFGMENQRI